MPEKSSEQANQQILDSDRESDNSDVQATRALIQKLSPAKPKAPETKVREIFYCFYFIVATKTSLQHGALRSVQCWSLCTK